MKILREPRSWSGLGPTALRNSAVPRRGSGPSRTKHLYFPSGSHWCGLRWRVGKSLESRCLGYEVRLPPVELEIPGVEIEKKRSRCCNEDPQIQVLLSPKEERQNLWPVQNEKDIRSLHGVRVVEELSILNSLLAQLVRPPDPLTSRASSLQLGTRSRNELDSHEFEPHTTLSGCVRRS